MPRNHQDPAPTMVSWMRRQQRPLSGASFVLLALLASACASTQKTDDKITVAAPTAGAAASQNPEDAVTPRARRLFDDAISAWEEQKKLRVYDWQLLESKFKAVVDADERFGEAWFNLGYVYEQLRRPDDAKNAYRTALAKKPTLKQAAENMAVMLQNEGRNADAVAIYQDILQKYPDDGSARARMAALYRESGDYERALRFAREALMREPQNLTAYKVLMRTYLDRNNLNMAKLVALRAKKIDQNDPELTYTIGLILLKEGDEQSAIAQFREALKQRDDYLVARLRIAEIAVKHQDWASAEEQYRKIAQYDGKNPKVHVNLGVAYKGLGQIDKAMAEYDQAMKADPSLAEPYFNMGVLFHRHKDAPDKAIEYYKKFLTASRDNVPAGHPVFEGIRECEQLVRAIADAKAAEEAAKKQAELEKQLEEKRKREADEKARQEEDAKKKAEREQRQKEAAAAVDEALKAGGQPPAPAPEQKPEEKKPEPPPAPPPVDTAPRPEPIPASGTAPDPDEPVENF